MILALKLLLTPFLIAMATLAGRRWGPGVSGWIAALPLTSGPVSIIFFLEYGADFAAEAAVGTLAGLIAVSAFCVTYCTVALRLHWLVTIGLAIATFLGTIAILNQLPLTLLPVFVAVMLVLTLALRIIPTPPQTTTTVQAPKWDLPARMITAVVFILLLTAAAEHLGPQLSGLLSPFPIFATVLAVFAHTQNSAASSIHVLRGILTGLYAFACFFLVVGALLTHVDPAITYAVAAAVAVGVNAFSLRFVREQPALEN